MKLDFGCEDAQKIITQEVVAAYGALCKWRKDSTKENSLKYEKLRHGVSVACKIFDLNAGDMFLYIAECSIEDFMALPVNDFYNYFSN